MTPDAIALRAELERLTRELAAGQRSLVQAGTEHARDLGHLADRNAEIRVLDTSFLRAKGQLAERTRERNDARREVCVMVDAAAQSLQMPFIPRGPEHVARFRGWLDLYPETTEEPKP